MTPEKLPDLLSRANQAHQQAVEKYQAGDREGAVPPAQEAVACWRRLAAASPAHEQVRAGLARALSLEGAVLSWAGLMEDALRPAEEAVSLYRALATANPQAFCPNLAVSLHYLAHILSEIGRREDALRSAEEAVSCFRALATANPQAFRPDLAMSLNNLTSQLSELGRREDALRSAEETAAIVRALATANPQAILPNLAGTLHTLANQLSELGRREDALRSAEEAVSIVRALATANPQAFLPNLAGTLHTLAIQLSELGRRKDALQPAEEAVALYRAAAGDSTCLFLIERVKSAATLAKLQLAVGLARAAQPVISEATKLTEHLRVSIRSLPDREAVLDTVAQALELRVLAALRCWQADGLPADLAEAVEAAEAARSRRLLDLLGSTERLPNAQAATQAEWLTHFRAVRDAQARLDQWETELRAAQLKPGPTLIDPPSPSDPSGATRSWRDPNSADAAAPVAPPQVPVVRALEAARAALDSAEAAHQRVLERVRQEDPGFEPFEPVKAIRLAEQQALLAHPNGSAWTLSWFVLAESTLACVLRSGHPPKLVELVGVGPEQVAQLTRDWFQDYHPTTEAEAKLETQDRARRHLRHQKWCSALPGRLEQVARTVLWPVLQALPPEWRAEGLPENLLLVPDRGLHLLPLHACPLPPEWGGGTLTDRFTITVVPSLSLTSQVVHRQRPRHASSLLVGDPGGDLDFTELECGGFASRFPQARILMRDAATPEAVLASASGQGLCHLSGHMTAGGGDPLEAAILLAGQGRLTLRDVYGRLRLDDNWLTVLNGCESGQLWSAGGRNFEGLPMGFLFAGATNVISTLWRVYDISSALLLDRFHDELNRPQATVAGALRRATDWLRGRRTERCPEALTDGQQLLLAVGRLIGRLDRERFAFLQDPRFDATVSRCQAMARELAAFHPDSPPFAGVEHWAAHVATGASWLPLPETKEEEVDGPSNKRMG